MYIHMSKANIVLRVCKGLRHVLFPTGKLLGTKESQLSPPPPPLPFRFDAYSDGFGVSVSTMPYEN